MTLTSQAQLEVHSDPTIRRFEVEVGQLWPYVAPLMARYQGVTSDAELALSELTESLKRKAANPLAVNLAISGYHFRKVCESHVR